MGAIIFPASSQTKPVRVAVLGDSITGYNAPFGAYGASGYMVWARAFLGSRFELDVYGYSGQTAGQILTHVGDALSQNPDIVCVLAGTNNISNATTAAAIFAAIKAVWDALQTAGKTVIAATLLPRGETDGRKAQLASVNEMMREYCRATPGAPLLVDWNQSVVNIATGNADTAFLSDSIHPIARGAVAMGKRASSLLGQMIPPMDCLQDVASAKLIPFNSYLSGNTGGVATGWTLSVGVGGTATGTKVSRTDGVVNGEWQRIEFTNGSNSLTDSWTLFQQNLNAGTDFSAGDTIRTFAEFQVEAGTDLRYIVHRLTFYGTSESESLPDWAVMGDAPQGANIGLPTDQTITLVSRWRTIPSSTSRLQLRLIAVGNGAIKVGRLGVEKQ